LGEVAASFGARVEFAEGGMGVGNQHAATAAEGAAMMAGGLGIRFTGYRFRGHGFRGHGSFLFVRRRYGTNWARAIGIFGHLEGGDPVFF
jgi:hypothetical protein